ncbi:MAG: hypothetical protein WCG75_01000 [Armatimonadota bacterium]
MGWEICRGKRYYVIRRKIEGKVIRRSGGKGEVGQRAALAHANELRYANESKLRAKSLHQDLSNYEKLVEVEIADALASEGFEKRNGRWTSYRVPAPPPGSTYVENVKLAIHDKLLRDAIRQDFERTIVADSDTALGEQTIKVVDLLEETLDCKYAHPIERIIQRSVLTFWLHGTLCDILLEGRTEKLYRTDSPYFWSRAGDRSNARFMRALARLSRVRKLLSRN